MLLITTEYYIFEGIFELRIFFLIFIAISTFIRIVYINFFYLTQSNLILSNSCHLYKRIIKYIDIENFISSTFPLVF